MRKFITILLMSFAVYSCFAQGNASSDSTAVMTNQKVSFLKKIINYFDDSNKEKSPKAFDISFIGGPHYSSDTKFGIGAVAAGVYRHDPTDTITQPSNVSIYLDATTSMFFKIGVKGINFFRHDDRRFSYDVNIASVYSKFWGIGYENAVNNDNESKYKYVSSEAYVEYLWRIKGALYAGPTSVFNYIHARDLEKNWLWEGQSDRIFNLGVGFTIQYDTRDNITASTKGHYINFRQMFNPKPLFNKYAFSLTELSASSYNPLWRDAVLATNLHARFTYGDTPWNLLSYFGGSHNMRGYYEGRYRDKCEADVCVELRQHIWRRNGVVAWVGAGSVVPDIKKFTLRKILPNYGIGYRWEFKHLINVRLDLGFGRNQTGFIFSINEAF